MIYYMDDVTNKRCRELLDRMERLVFTDYQLVYKFVEHCEKDIERLHCGRTAADDDNKDEVQLPLAHTLSDPNDLIFRFFSICTSLGPSACQISSFWLKPFQDMEWIPKFQK